MTKPQTNKGGRGHKALMLSPVQLRVLRAAATGASLVKVAYLTGLPVTQVSARLNQVYKRLDVANVPVGRTPEQRRTRRALAVAEARRRGHRI